MSWHYLDVGDFLVIAERILGVPAEALARSPRIGGAQSALFAPQVIVFGHEQFPDLPTKAAVLCARLIKNHPLPDGNKRVAFLCLVEFLERNGVELIASEAGLLEMLVGVAAGNISEKAFAIWISTHLHRRRPRDKRLRKPPGRRI